MSHQSKSHLYKGRYNALVDTSNLEEVEYDLPEYEPVIPRPRGNPPGDNLVVDSVDMCIDLNVGEHHTSLFMIDRLVVRRGQAFFLRINFNRPLNRDQDVFHVEFLIGSHPKVVNRTKLVVSFGGETEGLWTGQIEQLEGSSALVSILTPPSSIVGKFRVYAASEGGSRTNRVPETDLYLLFNAWCLDDHVFLGDEASRSEYVLNQNGIIYQGEASSVSQRSWLYGQFDQGILEACIFILDKSGMPISDRGDVVKMVRMASAMINSQDDSGVLVGNWGDDFSMGTSPTLWTGSVKILHQYHNSGVPVSFGQCWVYAGVLNTFLRCLGIPSRVVTNFCSAHDNTGNLKIDLIFKPDKTPDERNTVDSIWNYHCWNEGNMIRTDLPSGMGGWQVVDATPQETSDGHFRCGPTSVVAVKKGLVCYQYDGKFVFAEVNSDVVSFTSDKYGNLTPFKVQTDVIGQLILTKAVGANARQDVTLNYKNREGSAADDQAMETAMGFGMERDQPDLPEGRMTVTITADQVMIGQDVTLVIHFQSQFDEPQVVQALLSCSVVYYTGVQASSFKQQELNINVQPDQPEIVTVRISPQEYMSHLGSQSGLRFVVTGDSNGQPLSAMKVLSLRCPPLIVTASEVAQVNGDMFVTVSFTNSFDFTLKDISVGMEVGGVMEQRVKKYSQLHSMGNITWTETCTPFRAGIKLILACMVCKNMPEIQGETEVTVID